MSKPVTTQNDSEPIRAMMERVRNGDLLAYRELFGEYVEKVHLGLCQVFPRREAIHPLEREIFIDMWDRRMELIEGIQLDLWIRRRAVDSIKQHYLRGRRISARKRRRFIEDIESALDAAIAGELNPDDCPLKLELRRSLWTEVQAYIETQPDGAEPWNFNGILLWMMIMVILFVGFIYASFNFSIDLAPAEPPLQSLNARADASPEFPEVAGAAPAGLENREAVEVEPAGGLTEIQRVEEVLQGNEELLQLHNEYQALKTEFVDTIDVDETVHDAELQDTVEEELDVVEQSISEIVGLLGENPENQFLKDMLIKSYKQQVKLLKKFTFLNE